MMRRLASSMRAWYEYHHPRTFEDVAPVNCFNRPYLSYTWDGDVMFWRRHTYMVEWRLWYANCMKGPVPLFENRRYWQERLGRWLAVPWANKRRISND